MLQKEVQAPRKKPSSHDERRAALDNTETGRCFQRNPKPEECHAAKRCAGQTWKPPSSGFPRQCGCGHGKRKRRTLLSCDPAATWRTQQRQHEAALDGLVDGRADDILNGLRRCAGILRAGHREVMPPQHPAKGVGGRAIRRSAGEEDGRALREADDLVDFRLKVAA